VKYLTGLTYCIAGARDARWIPEGGGILVNIVDNCATDYKMTFTKNFIKESDPKVCFLDSSGYALWKAETKDWEISFDYSKPIKNRKTGFNVAVEHVVEKQKQIGATLFTYLDWPVNTIDDPVKQEIEFNKKLEFNICSATRTVEQSAKNKLSGKLLLSFQGYNITHLNTYFSCFKHLKYGGVCFPVRNMTLEQLAAFCIRIWQTGVRIIHILGTTTIRNLAIAAYMACHFFEHVSVDGTNWLWATKFHRYLDSVNLRRKKLNTLVNSDGKSITTCGCSVCKSGKLLDPNQSAFDMFAIHNCFVTCHAARMLYENATSIQRLEKYLQKHDMAENGQIIKAIQKIKIFKDASSTDLERYLK
jgi:hypothetical protein